MIPRTFLSTYAVNGQQQMVVAFLDNITGLTRWVDYIPVKLAQGGRENSYDNNGFIDVAVVAKSLTSVPFKDYVPVYADTAATDAWQVNFTGYIPYGYSGSGDASLMLDFTSNFQAFDSRITFTRASNATYFNSAGLLTNTSFNALTYSNNLENAAWTKTAATVTANVTTDPFGVVDAERLTEDTATSDHKIAQATASSVATQQTFSIYAKADTRSVLSLNMSNTGGNAQFNNFDLTAGTATGSSTTSLGWTGATASIVSVGNGWYRCILTANSSGTAGITATTAMVVGGSTSYTGNGTSGLFLYGAQLQTGVISAYIPTTTVANSLPRLDYNPATLAAQGLLIEEQRTNLLTYSDYFDNAAWTKANVIVSANVTISPDGNVNAELFIPNTTNADHSTSQLAIATAVSGSPYSLSVFAKAGGYNFVRLSFGGPAGGGFTFFNLATGVIGTSSGQLSSGITAVGNGWYRCTITRNAGSAAALNSDIYVTSADNQFSWSGDGTSGIYLYGAQLEAGAFATSYAPSVNTFTSRSTTGTFFDSAGVLQSAAINVARNTYNPANLAAQPFLLLEEARANLLTYSEQLDNVAWIKSQSGVGSAPVVTANQSAAPDGTATADLVALVNTGNTLSDWSWLYQNYLAAATTTYTFSAWLKAATPADVGKEITFAGVIVPKLTLTADWQRVSCTGTTVASGTISVGLRLRGLETTASSVSFFMWGAQLEAGAYLTSYIPTTTTALTRAADLSSSAQATRAADDAVMTGTNFSSWFNAAEGTFAASFQTTWSGNADASRGILGFDSSASKRIAYISSGASSVLSFDGVSTLPATGIATGVLVKAASAYDASGRYITNGGTAVQTGSVAAGYSTSTSLNIGNYGGTQYECGYIRSITYWPRRLSNAELQSLTT